VLGVVALVFGLKILFRAPPEIRQEGMWVMARQHGSDADDLRSARAAILDRGHGFARYEEAAIDAQLAVIDELPAEAQAFGKFCQTLAWENCEKQRVRDALKILFTEGNQ
jgi:hypothetical protein